MFKLIFFLFFVFSTIYATDVSPTSQNIRSYPLPEGKATVKANYNLISNSLDLFNVRDSKSGTMANHGSLGNLNGFDLTLGYGLYEHISLFYNFNYQDLDYASQSLKNSRHELFTKLNVYHNPSAFIDTFSTDFGFIHNSGNDLTMTGSSLGISKMDDMSDSSFYIRLLAGTRIMSSVLDFYLGLKHTSIDTKLDGITHDRNEIALNGGFQYTLELGTFLIETGYEYIKLFSRDVDSGEDSNHILNLTFSKALNQKLLLYIGSKFYIKQYNGVIPYLYNEKSKNEFDQKFGYATFGFVYNFDLEELN